ETFRRISGWRSSELKPHIAFTRSEFVLPQRTDLPDPLEAEAKYREALGKVDGQMWWMRSEGSLSEGERRIGAEVRNAWERWRTAVRGRNEWERKVEVQVIALGELALVGVSGELFVSLGLRIKRSSPFPFTFIVGYANGYNGYLTPEEAWKQGGYEVSIGQWAMCGRGSGEQVVKQALRLLHSLRF
ncbi:MAG: hypothetical protein XFASWVDF_002767, partial [Candidatus Fervidibacter sp.]